MSTDLLSSGVHSTGLDSRDLPDSAAVRAVATTLRHRATGLTVAARRATAQPGNWRGAGADAAADDRVDLAGDARRMADAHEQAGVELLLCANRLDEARALLQRAEDLAAQDRAEQAAAGRARAVLRAATLVGPVLPAYVWDHCSPLAVAAARLVAEADDLAGSAVRRAAAVLRELTPRLPPRDVWDHVIGFGRGAWAGLTETVRSARLASPAYAAAEPGEWWSGVRELGAGLVAGAQDPRGAAAAMLGLDLLSDGAYGEWVGAMAAGAMLPGSRITKLDDVARAVSVAAGTGGFVVLRSGLLPPRGFPDRIADLEPDRRLHILDGDDRGGGHRSGIGKPGKSEFPSAWSDDEIVRRSLKTALEPDRIATQADGRFLAFARHEGVLVKVVLEQDGRVVTAHPIDGPGVIRNPPKAKS